MTTSTANIAPSNPFSTRFVRPGAIPFLFPAGQNIQTLIARLEVHNWWGQIVGPHGTGKSTLIAELLTALNTAGREPHHHRLRDGVSTLPGWNAKSLGLRTNSILVIDGYEQIGLWRRWCLRRACRQAGCGLLVTAHAPIGLPNLYVTEITRDLSEKILAHLLRDGTPHVRQSDLDERLQIRHGNLRDALFDLYDLHERRTRCRVHSNS